MPFAILSLAAAVIMTAPVGQSPGPAPSGDPFAGYSGAWACEGRFVDSGRTVASEVAFESVAPGLMVKLHRDLPPGQYLSRELWASAPGGKFSSAIASRGGLRVFDSSGPADGSLTWHRAEQETGREERFVYALADDRLTIEWWRSREGELRLGDRLECRRVGGGETPSA